LSVAVSAMSHMKSQDLAGTDYSVLLRAVRSA
jgi:hypothetical protein